MKSPFNICFRGARTIRIKIKKLGYFFYASNWVTLGNPNSFMNHSILQYYPSSAQYMSRDYTNKYISHLTGYKLNSCITHIGNIVINYIHLRSTQLRVSSDTILVQSSTYIIPKQDSIILIKFEWLAITKAIRISIILPLS